MCIILFSWQPERDTPLVVAANRDEFHHRPAEAARWRSDVLCGLDLEANGTWLGVTRAGRFAAVTNYREPIQDQQPGRRSRGMLPLDFLHNDLSPAEYMDSIVPEQEEFGGFNLLAGDGRALWYMSNRGAAPCPVEPGIHALSNGLLDTTWPKTERGKARLAQSLDQDDLLPALLDVLRDDTVPDDSELPQTGVGLELERLVAPIFIASATYGTRASTALAMSADGGQFTEQRWQPSGMPADDASTYHW
jgi:uncharacterized protein with NRDE domain